MVTVEFLTFMNLKWLHLGDKMTFCAENSCVILKIRRRTFCENFISLQCYNNFLVGHKNIFASISLLINAQPALV